MNTTVYHYKYRNYLLYDTPIKNLNFSNIINRNYYQHLNVYNPSVIKIKTNDKAGYFSAHRMTISYKKLIDMTVFLNCSVNTEQKESKFNHHNLLSCGNSHLNNSYIVLLEQYDTKISTLGEKLLLVSQKTGRAYSKRKKGYLRLEIQYVAHFNDHYDLLYNGIKKGNPSWKWAMTIFHIFRILKCYRLYDIFKEESEIES